MSYAEGQDRREVHGPSLHPVIPIIAPRDIRALLAEAGARPKKGLGQHFLIDGAALRDIVAAIDPTPDDTVVEVGPGLGVLTAALVERAGSVIVVELDAGLCRLLERRFSTAPNLRVLHKDGLEFSSADLPSRSPYKMAGNLPYYVASAVVRRFLELEQPPTRLVVMVQREVAQGMTAKPGDMSVLSVAVQVYGQPRIVRRVSPGSFYPAPSVESAVVRIDAYKEPLVPRALLPAFFRLVKAGFGAPRKQLRNTMAAGLGLSPGEARRLLTAAGIDPTRRAETLSVQEWRKVLETAQRETPSALETEAT